MASTTAPETIAVNGRQYRSVREGLASVLAPYRTNPVASDKKAKNNDEGDQAVFYNPIQQFNRDLSVLAILIYGEGAVLEKQARFLRKSQNAKSRKGKARKLQTAVASQPTGHEAGTSIVSHVENRSHKRKADDLEDGDGDQLGDETAKKTKMDEFDVDDEELAVEELNGNGNGNPDTKGTTLEGPQQPAGEKEIQAPVQGFTAKRQRVPFTILDALSATGLRALRYAKEIPFATNIVANDLSPDAVKAIELNIDHNDVKGTVHSNVGDARAYMYSKVGNEHQNPSPGYVHRFDVIDLDPYGTAAPFFDASLQALQDGGLLCVTCTDAGVFASNGYPEKAYALYGGIPLKGAHSHEGGLRLILHAVATSAAKYGIAIEPLLSLSIDFYARLFIRIHKQQKDVKLLAGTTMNVYNCDNGCGAWKTQLLARNQAKEDRTGARFYKHSLAQAPSTTPSCEHCGSKLHLGGPMWAGPLHNPYFVQRILDRLPVLDKTTYGTLERLRGMLTLALEEDLTLESSNSQPLGTSAEDLDRETPDPRLIPRLPPDTVDATPFFFIPNYLAKVVHCVTPPENPLRGAIRHRGYRVTRSHCKAGSFKTNAPWSVLWEIMREWVRTKAPIKEGAVKENTPGWRILARTRGTEQKVVSDMKEDVKLKLDKCQSLEDVETLVQSAMWRLEHDKKVETGAANGANRAERRRGEDEEKAPAPESGEGGSPRSPTSALDIVFDERLGEEKPRGKLVRYQINPRANWGPMNRAGSGDGGN